MILRSVFVAMVYLGSTVLGYGFGIDWGSELHKSTILIPEGGFRMVENDISKRKTPSMVSFCGKDRLLESQALAKFVRQTCQTFYHMNRFFADSALPEDFADLTKPIEDQFSHIFPTEGDAFAIYKRTKSQKLALANGANLPDFYIRFEEILAMMLQREKKNAATTGNGSFSSAAFTIWDNSLSIATRKQLLAAIRLAGIKPLGFIHENVAALTYLSMDRIVEKETSVESVLLVNVGANGVKLTISNFEPFTQVIELTKQTKLLPAVTNIKDEFNQDFTGLKLDECLATLALKKQAALKKKNVSDFKLKTVQKRRLIAEANKAKEMLSANKEISFIIEDFFDDSNFNIKISRAEFEEGCNDLFQKFVGILSKFIDGQKVTRVEAIGGIVRIPKFQELIKSVTKLPVGSRINGDEGPAMGAALFAANNTSGLKLKKIILNDGPNYSVNLTVSFAGGNNTEKSTELFPMKTNYATGKKINIKKLGSDVIITLAANPGNYTIKYNVSGVEKHLKNYAKKVVEDWKGLFTFELDSFGIPKLNKAELILKENVTETVNKTLPKQNTSSADGDKNSSAPKYTLETKTTQHVRTEKLSVNLMEQTYRALNDDKELYFDSQELLKAFNEKEERERNLAKLRNKLETYVYQLKAAATDDDTSIYLNETEIEEFKAKSDAIEDFLFDANSEQKAIEKMTFEADKMMDIVKERRNARNERADVWKRWHDFLKNSTGHYDKLRRDKHWVDPNLFNELLAEINTSKEKMDMLHEQQKELKMSEDPVFKSEIVQNKMNEISAKLSAIMKMTKPKEGHKDKPDKAETAKEDQGEATKPEADKGTKKEEKEAEEL